MASQSRTRFPVFACENPSCAEVGVIVEPLGDTAARPPACAACGQPMLRCRFEDERRRPRPPRGLSEPAAAYRV